MEGPVKISKIMFTDSRESELHPCCSMMERFVAARYKHCLHRI